MKHSEFKIGGEFTTGSGRWRCTDVGTRTAVAFKLDKDPSWYAGPPYAVEEVVFDENEFGGCEPATEPQESVLTPGVQSQLPIPEGRGLKERDANSD